MTPNRNRPPPRKTPGRRRAAPRGGGRDAHPQDLPDADVRPGVLLDIDGLGTLILGESGIGKSESALELIDRGHRLVADDVVEIERRGDALVGRSPALTRNHMEIRGVGIIDVRVLFGPRATAETKELELVILLEPWDRAATVERLGVDGSTMSILGVELPLVRMPVGPGRNLAMLIEVATRNQLSKRQGRDAARRFVASVDRITRRRGRGRASR